VCARESVCMCGRDKGMSDSCSVPATFSHDAPNLKRERERERERERVSERERERKRERERVRVRERVCVRECVYVRETRAHQTHAVFQRLFPTTRSTK